MFKKIVLFTVVFSFFSANLFAYHFKLRKFEKRKTNDFLELSCSSKKEKASKMPLIYHA